MIAKTNINWPSLTDDRILERLGEFIKEQRVYKRMTQDELAKAAGLNRYTISKIENGESVTMSVFIQILRALDLLHVLDTFVLQPRISPLEAVKLQPKRRERVRKIKKKPSSKTNNPNSKSDW